MLYWLHEFGGQTCGRAASRFAVSVKCANARRTYVQPAGLLQPMPLPTRRFGHWSINFMTNLPLCGGKNAIMTCIEGLFVFVRVIPCYMGERELSAEQVATLFFNAVVRLFGLPDEVLHDRDPRFTADFWRHLWDSLGSRAVFSSAYHP